LRGISTHRASKAGQCGSERFHEGAVDQLKIFQSTILRLIPHPRDTIIGGEPLGLFETGPGSGTFQPVGDPDRLDEHGNEIHSTIPFIEIREYNANVPCKFLLNHHLRIKFYLFACIRHATNGPLAAAKRHSRGRYIPVPVFLFPTRVNRATFSAPATIRESTGQPIRCYLMSQANYFDIERSLR
jgi:hypothetical protein